MDSMDVLESEASTNWSIEQEHSCYIVTRKLMSSTACIFFVENEQDSSSYCVIKILLDYEDTRYHQKYLSGRCAAQLEALHWNPKFTSNVYLGLAPILAPDLETLKRLKVDMPRDQRKISIGKLSTDPYELEQTSDPKSEYALVMKSLPDKYRLDHLLLQYPNEGNPTIQHLLAGLLERIIEIQKTQPSVHDQCDKDGLQWGSYQQLIKKLDHNFGLFKRIANKDARLHQQYAFLTKRLRKIVRCASLQYYFQLRVSQGYIKRCHGDLKADNIWLEENEHRIHILDAIDFNPSYCHIDTLSDIAMLVIDVQAYTQTPAIANYLISSYLQQTGLQNDMAAQTVLRYYLVEKAIVRAAVNIAFDQEYNPLAHALGKQFLKIAEQRMRELEKNVCILSGSSSHISKSNIYKNKLTKLALVLNS